MPHAHRTHSSPSSTIKTVKDIILTVLGDDANPSAIETTLNSEEAKATAAEVQRNAKRPLRYAPMTEEKAAGAMEIIDNYRAKLHQYALDNNLNPTAVQKLVNSNISFVAQNPWRAFQRLRGIARCEGLFQSIFPYAYTDNLM